MLKKFKDFLIEYDVISIGIFLLLSIFSYKIIDIIFFTVSPEFLVQPTLEVFYYALFSILIWLGFWVVTWVWVKWNFPELANKIKEPPKVEPYQNQEINYTLSLIALFIFFGSLLGVAAIVFP